VAKLDQNESPLDLPGELKSDLLAELATSSWNRYPQPSEYEAAKRGFADAVGLDPDGVVLTAGCDQAIQGAHLVAGGPGRRALVFEPTYPMLAHAGLMAGTTVVTVDLGVDYALRPEHLRSDVDLLLVASPNNPTGVCVEREVVEAALALPCFVFVDEAYHDLSGVTSVDLLRDHPNLMIGRSCSKSLLAGMRLGYTISHPDVALRLDQMLTAPYHLSHAQLLIARRFAELREHVATSARRVIAERERLTEGLLRLGLTPAPSQANFVLVRVDDAASVHEALALRGIRVRYAPRLAGLEHHLRITVGTAEENDLVLRELGELLLGA
jgi:histidinol-phosphate aminotransferase